MIVHHIAREQITVSNAVKTLTAAKVDTARGDGFYQVAYADFDVQAADVRVTFDGSTAPAASTTGTLWRQGEKYRVWGIENLSNLIFIRDSSDATLVVDYWGTK